jgi:hypothetical protein
MAFVANIAAKPQFLRPGISYSFYNSGYSSMLQLLRHAEGRWAMRMLSSAAVAFSASPIGAIPLNRSPTKLLADMDCISRRSCSIG